ncbi:transcriptional activator RfaH [Desulfotalea psychrophila]|nr:transcriptional activator RfaH [Desulfotalea psychrophila]
MMRDNETEGHWYAIRTKNKKEEVAKFNYQRQGYTVYLPLLRKTVHHARSTTEKLVAFFPGYLFLNLAPAEQNWTAIASTRGSLGALCFGDSYIEIPGWVISDLKAREDKGLSILAKDLIKENLTPGSVVTVNIPGLESVEAVVYSIRGSENVDVLLNILSRQVKTTVSLDRIKID